MFLYDPCTLLFCHHPCKIGIIRCQLQRVGVDRWNISLEKVSLSKTKSKNVTRFYTLHKKHIAIKSYETITWLLCSNANHKQFHRNRLNVLSLPLPIILISMQPDAEIPRIRLGSEHKLVQSNMTPPDFCEDITVNTVSNPSSGELIHLWLAFLLTVLESGTNT